MPTRERVSTELRQLAKCLGGVVELRPYCSNGMAIIAVGLSIAGSKRVAADRIHAGANVGELSVSVEVPHEQRVGPLKGSHHR
jgi:hypothetical protein